MKVLVTAASKYGATEEIARTIAGVLKERGSDLTVIEPQLVRTIDDYDAIVLGSAVYAGHWMKSAKELVDGAEPVWASKPVWLFSSGPVGDPLKPDEEPVDVAQIMETTRARDHRLFAGKVVKKQLSFPERALVSALRVPEGDFRDWDAIRGWAGEIAEALEQPA